MRSDPRVSIDPPAEKLPTIPAVNAFLCNPNYFISTALNRIYFIPVVFTPTAELFI